MSADLNPIQGKCCIWGSACSYWSREVLSAWWMETWRLTVIQHDIRADEASVIGSTGRISIGVVHQQAWCAKNVYEEGQRGEHSKEWFFFKSGVCSGDVYVKTLVQSAVKQRRFPKTVFQWGQIIRGGLKNHRPAASSWNWTLIHKTFRLINPHI